MFPSHTYPLVWNNLYKPKVRDDYDIIKFHFMLESYSLDKLFENLLCNKYLCRKCNLALYKNKETKNKRSDIVFSSPF